MKNNISEVVSRRTLQKQKVCSAYLFSKVEERNSTHWDKSLQGFTISNSIVKSMEEAKELIVGLDNIHINLLNSQEGCEILFVEATTITLNSWYKTMWEGNVASRVCEKFNYFQGKTIESIVKNYRKKMEEEMKDSLIQI
jgi:hypothetical protein